MSSPDTNQQAADILLPQHLIPEPISSPIFLTDTDSSVPAVSELDEDVKRGLSAETEAELFPVPAPAPAPIPQPKPIPGKDELRVPRQTQVSIDASSLNKAAIKGTLSVNIRGNSPLLPELPPHIDVATSFVTRTGDGGAVLKALTAVFGLNTNYRVDFTAGEGRFEVCAL